MPVIVAKELVVDSGSNKCYNEHMFCHLHTHTEYSLLDGSNKIEEYVKRVSELGMTAAAITDHGVMYGAIDFYRAAKKQGIKPIIGCEVYVAPNSRFDKETTGGDDRYYHLILLAENNKGYSNLCKIVSAGFVDGFYYKPRVDMEILNKYHEGIICLSACLAGEVQRYIVKGLFEEAIKQVKKYRDCFGENNYFLELQDHGIPEQKTVNQALLRISKELNIPLVCTNDVHYTNAEDAEAHDLLLCIQTGKKVSDEDRMRYEGGQYYVKSEAEMRTLFPYALEAVENTQKIADRCNVEIEFGNHKLPHFDVPDGYDSWTYLRKLCYEGMERRYPGYDESLKKRLEYELDTIHNMGFVDYFLIVSDFIHYAKSHGIAVGPGRGSAAGSVVSYCLEITNIDPFKYNLLFERFLNPERVTMPDIDVDFCFEHRQDVIDYVIEKYGKDKVVQIVTFGTLAARGVLRDVSRVLDKPYTFGDQLAKMIPQELNMTLDKALEKNLEFKALYDSDEEVKYVVDMCRKLEGLPRHSSMHAAGVLICPESADEYVPLSRSSDGTITTQYVMTTLEELGLLKMDFLGLRTLTVIQNAVKNIKSSKNIDIDIDNINYDDEGVYSLIGSGKCEGIFQLESAGMKNFMKELKPKNLEDVIAGIALYRPGPMDFIPKYLKGKNTEGNIEYSCEQLRPILESTYGCIVYQEQVQQIVQALGGYTLGRADLIRRAMSKKKEYVMIEERKNFVYGNVEEGVSGCISKGIKEETANQIYDEMMDFAKYAFNKSHAAAYAVVSYQTAYLKHYYPVEYMAALMTSVIDAAGKVAEYIYVCKNMGIEILPPDINEGVAGFSVSGDKIRYGLASIKGIGWNVIDAVVEERKEHGPFKDIEDFALRLSGKEVNKRTIENFIKAGAFDSFSATRKQMMIVYSNVLDSISHEKKNTMAGQMSLFDFASEEEKKSYQMKLPNVGEYDKGTLLAYEKEVLGIYASGHPLDEYMGMWKKNITNMSTDFYIDEETGFPIVRDRETVTVGGIIESKQIKQTKNGKTMAFITVEDLVGTIECIVWPNDYEKCKQFINEDEKVFVTGKVSVEDDKDAKLLCDKIIAFSDIPKKLWIQFDSEEIFEACKNELLEELNPSRGKDRAFIYITLTKQIINAPVNHGISIDDFLVTRLKDKFGEDNVKVT